MQTVIALGTFDGMHSGHRAVVARAVAEAKNTGSVSMVYTFTTIPRALFSKAPLMLMTPSEREGAMREMGVEKVVMAEFNETVRNMPPGDFIEQLVNEYHPRALVTGKDYTFGAKGAGNVDTLKQFGKEMGFEVIVVPTVRIPGENGQKVSSTVIRHAICENRPEFARQLLKESAEVVLKDTERKC